MRREEDVMTKRLNHLNLGDIIRGKWVSVAGRCIGGEINVSSEWGGLMSESVGEFGR